MDIFTPVVPEEKQHKHFRFITQTNLYTPEISVINGWADSFIDRDGKFAKEFQTTFNSSFWELYLFACFKELNCKVDLFHETPDFVISSPYGDFIAEATTANHPEGFRPEWDQDLSMLDQISMDDMLRLSTIRLLNAITSKHRKYVTKYSKLAHVHNKPFVICVAPFEQPFFFFQNAEPIVRVLYAYEQPLIVPSGKEGQFIIIGESRSHRVQKKPGVDLSLGLFTNSAMSEVSAIIFNNKATLSKVHALAENCTYPVIFSGSRVVNSGKELGVEHFVKRKPNYKETLLDGVQILLNPFAKYPLDMRIFENKEVAVHDYDPQTEDYLSEFPNGFLLQRMCLSIISQDTVLEFKQSMSNKSYQELPAETWEENELVYVGGQNGWWRDNHIAHYRGWTAVVSFDSNDEDWSSLAVDSLCYNIPQFMKANDNQSIASTAALGCFSTKEEAYSAIKRKIDQLYDQNDNI
ncbi:hypothetical protein [Nostoc sp. UHCC 0252]|uniref:hypothetical protein n=1 Tax=Nostoc sp. UHCC 0252 TaxID=3110241 RepID=UPI002B212E68|nr:hypothetical protein [Nostoc sp. UHCC 0252]MEA5605955.1 hypothetical protein [Nostoc sp. UHCC 0252]